MLFVGFIGCGGLDRRDASGGDAKAGFDHAGVPDDCAGCHDINKPYAAFPTGHRTIGGLDCGHCHDKSTKTWAGGIFHSRAGATPTSCLPCHQAQAPTSTAGWQSATYPTSPFDYGGNSLGFPHGGGQDCAACHTGPGTGAWGKQPNWAAGHFAHATFSLADKTCLACHVSQRPDLQPRATPAMAAAQIGFDHAPIAAVDCIGCHFATVVRESYVDYFDPRTSALPGGDWRGGQAFPGSRPVGFPGERLELWTTTLALSAAGDRVTSASADWEQLPSLMIHTSLAVPPPLRPGPTEAPDYGKCWHCHVHKDGVVTMFPTGKFHSALGQYAVTPDAPVTPLSQPTRGCKECHATTQPAGIVGRSSLKPMQHGVLFASPVSIAGETATGVRDLECSACHLAPAEVFAQAVFHANTASASLRDCVSCHYLTLADEDTADVRNGTAFQMRHTSAQVPFHNCIACHPSARAAMATPIVAAESWKPGVYHAVVPTQPFACNDCHAVSAPAGHDELAAGRDCGACHSFPGTGSDTAPNWRGAAKLP